MKKEMVYVAGPDNGVLIISPEGEHLGSISTTQRTSNSVFGDGRIYAVHKQRICISFAFG